MKMAASFASTRCFLPLYQSRHLQNNTTSSCSTVPLHLNRNSNSNSKLLSLSSSHAGRNGFNAVVENERKKDRLSSFSQTAAVRNLMGSVTNTQALRFAVVVARFNEIITKRLLEGALSTFHHYSVLEGNIDVEDEVVCSRIMALWVVWVPGSFEIGVAAERLGKSQKYHAVLCIGAVIRGDTSHYDVVVNSAASGVLSAGLNSGVPCIFGVLTCDNMDQGLNRAGGKSGNKGSETALTAIEVASLFEHHLK